MANSNSNNGNGTEEKKGKFVGNGKTYGKKIALSLDWAELLKLTKNEFNGKKYLLIDVLPLQDEDQYKRTHCVVEHIYKKKNS